jgi:hypothetical protein
MHRRLIVIATIMLSGLGVSAAEVNVRYVLEKVEQGFLRLDSETGAVALCSARAGVWECAAVKDQGLPLAAELGRLKAENDRLKARVAELEKPGAPQKFPSDQEVDRMMDIFGKMFERFLDFAREMDGKGERGTAL